MFRKISGKVESIRSVAIVRDGNSHKVEHQNLIRVGGESVSIDTERLLNLQPGDTLTVAVYDFLRWRYVLRWHASSGARDATVRTWHGVVAAILGFLFLAFGIGSHWSWNLAAPLGVMFSGGSILILRLSAGAKKVLSEG